MDKKYLVCLVCCEEFKDGCGGGDLGRKEENVQSLKQFCEVILEVDKNKVEGKGDFSCFNSNYVAENLKGSGVGRDELKSKEGQSFGGDEEDGVPSFEIKLSKFLKNEDDNLSICRDCLDLIRTTTDARLLAREVEEKVEKLQMLLLGELRRLQGRLDLFWRKFVKMEETLVNGDLNFVENGLDASYSERNEDGKGKRRRLSKKIGKISQEPYLERKNEIFGFRGKISEVFRDFHQFQSKLVDKVACKPVKQTIRRMASSSKKIADAHAQDVKGELNHPKPKSTDKQPSQNNVLSSVPSSPSPPAFEDIAHDDLDDGDDYFMEMEEKQHMHLDNFNNNDDNFSEDNQVDVKPADKRKSLRRRQEKRKYQDNSYDSDEDDPVNSEQDEDGNEIKPKVETGSKQAAKRSRLRRDNDEEYNPEEDDPLNATPSYKTIVTHMLREYEPHLSQVPQFHRKLVRSLLQFRFRCENLQKRKGPENTNVYHSHLVDLSYNMETQLINLKDISIKIICQAAAVGEEGEANGLLCTRCNFKVDECPKLQTLMFDHILSQHLNAYQCSKCNKNFDCYDYYRNHLWKCLKDSDALRVTCEICGNRLYDRRALRHHKWKFHMSEEEKKEALESGQVKEYRVKSKAGGEKKFQCEQCGKSFVGKKYLHNHEETHKERDSREQFICPKCGKAFLKAGYDYHSKFSKSCGENGKWEGEKCEQCGRGFKSKHLLGRHIIQVHVETEKKWNCGVCGKGFKGRPGLKIHEAIHTGVKNWKCGRCGMGFGRPFNMRRHEKTCGK